VRIRTTASASEQSHLTSSNPKFTEFYMPEPYLQFGERKNILTVLLPYTETSAATETLSVQPYAEYSSRRTRVELEWRRRN
jgi:hypothetical protein